MPLVSILLPKLGESVTEATIIKWLKQPGDKIEKDETIAEVATDKVDTDLPSEYEGVLKEIFIGEGETVAVGKSIATIEVAEDQIVIKDTIEVKEQDSTSNTKSENNQQIKRQSKTNLGHQSGLYLTPVVRNIAHEAGLTPDELSTIQPTGSNKTRITKKDILNYLNPTEEITPSKSIKRTLKIESNDEVIPLTRMRKLIASHMSESSQTAAHVTSWVIADVTSIVTWRENHKVLFARKHKTKLTYTHIFMALVIESLIEYPKLNAWYNGEDELVLKGDINLGFAAATPDDNLIVPNIKSAETKALQEIVSSVNILGKAAKTKALKSIDIEGTTFTVSNTGIFGSLMGTPLIALPQVAILALGEITSAPGIIIKDNIESIAIVKQMHLSLSYDHRIIDGAYASRFLKNLKNRMTTFIELQY